MDNKLAGILGAALITASVGLTELAEAKAGTVIQVESAKLERVIPARNFDNTWQVNCCVSAPVTVDGQPAPGIVDCLMVGMGTLDNFENQCLDAWKKSKAQ